MKKKIQLLDCTLRDGAYIVAGNFGTPSIKGIIKKLQDANIDLIECGWLKDSAHKDGSTYYHVPSDLENYLVDKRSNFVYVAMIDWDRYNLDNLPECDGKSIDAIRVVFPQTKFREGIALCDKIRAKGYEVYLQAANTLGYSDEELKQLVDCVNKAHPVCISVVDTFGAMYPEDLVRILKIVDDRLDEDIKIGFHSHNNQQLSFALCMTFVKYFEDKDRGIIVDASLCGMGRGAGNATTELVASYLNNKHSGNYDINAVMDTIDVYMNYYSENYRWGYSVPYCIAGMFCCHVNNIAYLLENHRTNTRDMRNIIESLSPADRKKYDYDLLEEKFIENQNRIVDDEAAVKKLSKNIENKKVLLVAPGKLSIIKQAEIKSYIQKNKPVVIGVNAILPDYKYDYLLFVNPARYDYAKDAYRKQFENTEKIVLSNIKQESGEKETVVNYNRAIKRGWEHFDNAVICCLRLLDKLSVKDIVIAGFDGFKEKYGDSYADASLPLLNSTGKWNELNNEIRDMFKDFVKATEGSVKIEFLTESIFNG